MCASDVSSCARRSSSSFRCELCSCCIVDTGVASWPANKCTPSNLCPSTPETLGDNEEDFSRVRFCAASRILASVASFLEAPRSVMIVLCAPVMEEVRVYQRRELKRTHPLNELHRPLLRSEYHDFGCPPSPRTMPSGVIEHSVRSPASCRSYVDKVVGPGPDLGATSI